MWVRRIDWLHSEVRTTVSDADQGVVVKTYSGPLSWVRAWIYVMRNP